MNQVHGILHRLTDIGCTLELLDDDLKVRGHRDKLTPDLITELRANKSDLVTLLRETGVRTGVPGPRRASGAQEAPLSFAQERMWFAEKIADVGAQNNMPYALHLDGVLVESALEQALNEIVRRHEILRTTYHDRDGVPYQRVHACRARRLANRDMRASGLSVDSPDVASVLRREAETPFDLETEFPFRFELLVLGAEDHVLLLTLHHIASDGWSTAIIVRELGHFYDTLAGRTATSLPALGNQYMDYALWQRELMQGDAFAKQLEFWRAELRGAPGIHGLPLDRPRPSAQTFAGDVVRFELAGTTLQSLRELAASSRTTLFTVLQSAFALLLARWSGEQDIVMGTPVAGRTHAEFEPLIGFFVNTLVLRCRVRPEMTFRDLLAQSARGIQLAFENQTMPFDMLVNDLKPERSLGHAPLIQVMFTLRNNEQPPLRLEGLDTEILDNQFRTLKVDLELFATEQSRGLELLWNFSTDLFDHRTMQSMAESFGQLLRHIVREPDRRVSKLGLLEPARREALLRMGRRAPVHSETTVDGLVERWAVRRPEAVALKFGAVEVSYGSLNRRAERLARHIVAQGVAPEEPVAVCMDRSVEMIVAMLAVLKAGAAYVLLDPEYPAERIATLLEECGAGLTLTDAAQSARIGPRLGRRLRVDDGAYENEADGDLPVGDHRRLACVIYTSGSTGRPKGVLLRHEGIVRLVEPDGFIDFRRDDVVAQGSNCAFDLSMLEIWGALCNGARLVHVSRDVLLDGAAFRRFLADERISVLLVTSALFKHMAALVPDAFARLRVLMFGGEQADANAVNRVVACGKPEKMINAYGPAENSCVSTSYEITGTVPGSVPIGRAIPGAYHYVLDPERQIVPQGVVGELAVGGAGLARGYHNAPQVTDAHFVADPFRGHGARMYLTGDLVRYDANGDLQFIGRVDDQVKINGFRIEPGEVESALASIDGVREALVVVQEHAGEKYLVAYVVGSWSREIDQSYVREALAGRLPAHLVPYAVVVLDALPLTTNGKIDRKALPPAAFGRTQRFVAPETDTEARLVAIWSDLLQRQEVSCSDNFFEIGGHSLLATRLASAIAAAFQCDVSVRNVFEHSVLSELAAYVDTLQPAGPGVLGVAPPGSRERPSFAQRRLWFIDQLQGRAAAGQYNLTLSLRVVGPLRLTLLERALNFLLERHEVLRTVFSFERGGLRTAVAGSRLELVVEDCRGRVESQVFKRIDELAMQPFSLAEGPLLRAHALVVDEADHALLFCFHHIACDGWSIGLFAEELRAVYGQLLAGEPMDLPALPVQYADYAHWQHETLKGPKLERQLAYWDRQLAGLPASHSVPLDKPRPTRPTSSGATVSTELPARLVSKLRSEARRNDVTMFMLYQAAFAALLSRWSYSDDIVMGVPIAGRQHRDLESLIGFFVNTLVLRSDLSGTPTFRQLLKRTKTMAMDAFDHQDVPFEVLVQRLLPERSINQNPLFQIMFSMHNGAPEPIRFEGTETSVLGVSTNSVKFDLALNVADTDDGSYAVWEYNTELFGPGTVSRLADHFVEMLQAAATRPDVPIPKLDVLTDGDRMRLNGALRAGEAVDLPADCVHELIEAQAAAGPQRTALEWRGAVTDYRTLNARANRVARYLHEQGLEPGSLVGVCLNRTPELVVAVLAVLKAGCAYVPLDPSYPARRLQQVVEDSDLAVILTETSLLPRLPAGSRTTLMDESDRFERCSGANLRVPVGPDSLIYVLYTSGSTGRPKGVEITHGNVLSLLGWAARELTTATLQRTLLGTSLSFDPSVLEFFAPLAFGCTAVLVDDGLELLREEAEVSYIGTVPSVLQKLVDHDALPKGLVAIGCGGEPLSASLVNRVMRSSPGARLYNLYGPTECTVNSTFDVYEKATSGQPSIGRPVANTDVYVLSGHGRQLPVGAVGELCIGGKAVGRGYHDRPDLTRERFVDFESERGVERLYRTGDLVRFLSDGRLRFLGRIDEQVKIRGHRVELGEIESALQSHPRVAQALVLARDFGGDKRLVAYVVELPGREGEAAADPAEPLRRHVASMLPGYMVPASIVGLARFPTLPNGKIDKAGLPHPDECVSVAREAPATDLESRLQSAWAEVLSLPVGSIGVTDSFFALGGHSLLIVELIDHLRDSEGAELSVPEIYRQPSIRQLAKAIEAGGSPRASDGIAVSLQPGSDAERPLFLIHPIGGDVYCYAQLLADLDLACPVYGLQRPELAAGRDVASYGINVLATTYRDEMLALQSDGPFRLLGWSLGGLIALRIAALLEEQGHEVRYLGLVDTLDHSQNRPLLEELGVSGDIPESLDQYLDSCPDRETFCRRFDEVFRIGHLLTLHRSASRDYLRKLIFSGLTASLGFRFEGTVSRMCYYGARKTRGEVPEEAIERILALARAPAVRRDIDGDHHSVMRRPDVTELARHVRRDLVPGTSTGNGS